MKQTTLHIEPDLDYALARLAAERGVTKAEVIRVALREATGLPARPRIRAIGVANGPGVVAGDVERHLRETGFGTP